VLTLIRKQFFIFAEQRFHAIAFSDWISTATGLPARGFISKVFITSV
jgi:hypothetical protein